MSVDLEVNWLVGSTGLNLYVSNFTQSTNQILNKTILVANGTKFRICELEMYLRNHDHPDEYVHKNSVQLAWKKFYFHKFPNGIFKARDVY